MGRQSNHGANEVLSGRKEMHGANEICMKIVSFEDTRVRGGLHHQKVDHGIRPINDEKAPKIGACVSTPYFSNVVAAES